jgi:uncharacterized protein (DUF433 family)
LTASASLVTVELAKPATRTRQLKYSAMANFPGTDSRSDVCDGESCIVRTRIPVWLLEQAQRLGASEQALLAAYPSLRAEDLVNAWAYARSHAAEIEAQIRENEAA